MVVSSFGTVHLHAQELITVAGRIQDSASKQGISYATVAVLNKSRGTVSDFDGRFSLQGIEQTDSLKVSCVGYHTLILGALDATELQTIILHRRTQEIQGVPILADYSFLYDVLDDCKALETAIEDTSKVYYSFETWKNNRKVESVDSYFNGHFSNYRVNDLKFKQGRLALKEENSTIHISSETSRLFTMFNMFDKPIHFPANPFALNKRAMKKRYKLKLITQYMDHGHEVMHIGFKPRNPEDDIFSGEVWVDTELNQILKIDLTLTESNQHPFVPHMFIDSIQSVDLHISNSYTLKEKGVLIDKIQFEYKVNYLTSDGLVGAVDSRAITYAFNYEEPFDLPKFEFSEGAYMDYIRINASPANAFFWENFNEFEHRDVVEGHNAFLEDEEALSDGQLFKPNQWLKNGLFEAPYVPWSENRVFFKRSKLNQKPIVAQQFTMPSSQYNLNVQVYMDVNELNDSLHVLTSAIFDPYTSYYYYPQGREGNVFLNIWFDFVEAEHREFVKEISLENLSKEDLYLRHDAFMEKLNNLRSEYYKDVEHGTNEEGLQKWNTIVLERMGIDNLSIFLEEDAEY